MNNRERSERKVFAFYVCKRGYNRERNRENKANGDRSKEGTKYEKGNRERSKRKVFAFYLAII